VVIKERIWGVFYRKGEVPNVFHIADLSMAQVRAWTQRNFRVQQGHEPLHSQAAWSELVELMPLVRGLDTISEDSMIVFCPTRELHSIPLHALSTGQQTIIERNAVAYCQSLSILHRCQMVAEDVANHSTQLGKTAILCVLDDHWHEVATYEDIGQRMKTKSQCVQHISSNDALHAMAGASILHFHGHAHTNDSTGNHLGMESYLSLGKKAPVTGLSRTEKLTANNIIDLTLHPGALALLIACRSGSADVSVTDDLLGLPTALFYAGATSVIGTLWEINNEDGMLFSETFYEILLAEKAKSIKTGATTLNVAVVLRKTMLHIMKQGGPESEKVMPYHWASFTLFGFWEIPLAFLQD